LLLFFVNKRRNSGGRQENGKVSSSETKRFKTFLECRPSVGQVSRVMQRYSLKGTECLNCDGTLNAMLLNRAYDKRKTWFSLLILPMPSPLNPLSPDIKMHILITDLYTFLMELVRRICLNIKTSQPQWSLPIFLPLECSSKLWSWNFIFIRA